MNSIALLYALYLLCLPLFYNLSQSGKECKGVFSLSFSYEILPCLLRIPVIISRGVYVSV